MLRRFPMILLDDTPAEGGGGVETPAAPPKAGKTAGETAKGKRKDPAELGLAERLDALEKKNEGRFSVLEETLGKLSKPAPAPKPDDGKPKNTTASGKSFIDSVLETIGLG